MRIDRNKILFNIVWAVGLSILPLVFSSCSENDDLPPILTMNPPDSVYHVLNEIYNDPGASAIDETDGDLSSNIYIDNQVDEDRVGEYLVSYSVVDKAGNEAAPASRTVFVYNSGVAYYGNYNVSEVQAYPESGTCAFPSYLWVDSTVNNRIVFLDFACGSAWDVYADIHDSIIVMPFQMIEDSLISFSLQGDGTINDSIITMEYKKTNEGITSLWNATYERVQ